MLHGTHRYVFGIRNFVLKVPRIGIFKFLRVLIKDIRHCKCFWFSRHCFGAVFAGLMENFREARCYLNTRHRLLAQLYLPLLFVNIYRREDGVGGFGFESDELFYKVGDSGDNEFLEALRPCSHTFDNSKNFAYSEGRVRVLDYGEKGFENLLTKHGAKVEKLLLSVAK